MGRVCYGPSLSWAEFVMGRVVQLPNDQPRKHITFTLNQMRKWFLNYCVCLTFRAFCSCADVIPSIINEFVYGLEIDKTRTNGQPRKHITFM